MSKDDFKGDSELLPVRRFGVECTGRVDVRANLPLAHHPNPRIVSVACWLVLTCTLITLPLWAGPSHKVTRQVFLMGTRCTLVVYADERRKGLVELEGFVRILEQTERELSTWREDSVLSRLNRHPVGMAFVLDENLCPLFGRLLFWSRATGRAFDPGVGALIDVWGIRRDGGNWPSEQALESAQWRSGVEHLVLKTAPCRVIRERDVILDAGAFGKGEALDRVAAEALRRGTPPWLIDLGGQTIVGGTPSADRSWKISIAHPLKRKEPFLEVKLDSGVLSTSGGSERSLLVNGQSINHILDPRNGQPAGFRGSVTVWHPRGISADILSTALYVMGPEEGLSWAEARDLAVCFFVPSGDISSNSYQVHVRPSHIFRQRFLQDTN